MIFIRLLSIVAAGVAWNLLGTGSLPAQEAPTDGWGCQRGELVEQFWDFGMRITAQAGAAGITATVPIPNEWPEQQIEIVEELKSTAVARISIKNLPNNARQMIFRVNRLNPGEYAEAVVRVRVAKHHLSAPPDPSQLSFTEKPASKFRQYLRPSPFIESNHERIKAIAEELAKPEGRSDYEHAEFIYHWVRDKVEYEFDTTIRSCLEALDAGKGDCEELSSLFIAICRAQGIPARAVWIPEHTYPEFLMVDQQGNPHWIPCQIAGEYEFGAMSENRPVLQKGDKFKVPGEKKPVRYVKPTLIAKETAGAINLKWIMRQVKDANEGNPRKETPSRGGLLGGG